MVPERISRALSAYVDGELDARQCKAVARLLRRSSEARELLRGLQKDAEQLNSLPCQTLGPDFSDQVLHSIASRKAKVARISALTVSNVPSWLGLATAAAAVFLVVGLRSYLYFATADRPAGKGMVARNSRQSGPEGSVEGEAVAAAVPKLAERELQLAERELLHNPVAEIETKPALIPQVAGTEDGKAESKARLLGSPLKNNSERLNDPEERVGLICKLGDLDPAKLQRELQKWAAHTVSLHCTNPIAGLEGLQTAFKSQGIQFVIDPDAKAVLKLGMGKNTSFALYFEDVTAEEIVVVLRQLDSADAERKRAGASRFDSLMVNAMAKEEEQKLWRLFGVDPARLRKQAPGVDFRGPLPSPDRRAMVVAYTPGRLRPVSAELKRFVDNRRERRDGALQIVLVINSAKS
jgi:hypothetical protein